MPLNEINPIKPLNFQAFICHLGDYDPSGVNAGEKIEQTLREMASKAEIHFEWLAINLDQVHAWNLPSRPTRKSDSRAKNLGEISVELDAILPDQLRQLVDDAIQRHIDPQRLAVLYAAKEDERRLLHGLAAMIGECRHD
jgi:hypothetical protein